MFAAKRDNGFTLLETVIALAVWLVIAAAAGRALIYAARASERLIGEREAFENARASLDAICANIRMAQKIVLETDGENVLKKLTLTEKNGTGLWDYEFYFNKSAAPGEAKYHRLEFGRNDEFASRIESVTMELVGDGRIEITVTTDGELCEAVKVRGSEDVRYKSVVTVVTP